MTTQTVGSTRNDSVEVRLLVKLLDLPERAVRGLLADLELPCWEYRDRTYTSRAALRSLLTAMSRA